jgi:DNA-binding GntR family transcriptional regulator
MSGFSMRPALSNKKEKQSLSAVAYAEIYRRIMTLTYEPGQRLEEKRLMVELGIGRTPIREALVHLADDFMVESHPKAGAIVRPITLQNTRSTFAALKVLETGVAELAVRQEISAFLPEMVQANKDVKKAVDRMDPIDLVETNSRFHHAYARCSKNRYLITALHKIRCESNRLAFMSYGNEIEPDRSLKSHYRSVVREHDTIIKMLKERDERRLKATVAQHIRTFQDRIIRYMASG